MTRLRRIILYIIIGILLTILIPSFICRAVVNHAAAPFIFSNYGDLGRRHVAVILCSMPRSPLDPRARTIPPNVYEGAISLHWSGYRNERAKTAAYLYRDAGVSHIIISGTPDQVSSVRYALINLGVANFRIIEDTGATSMFSSVVRARDIYGLQSCIFVTQPSDASRAVYLARAYGIDAVAFPAQVPSGTPFRNRRQMYLGNLVGCFGDVLDTNIFNRNPHADGEPVLVPGLVEPNEITLVPPPADR